MIAISVPIRILHNGQNLPHFGIHMRTLFKSSILLLSVSFFVACSDDEPSPGWRVSEGDGDQTEFGDDNAVIVTADGDTFVVTGSGEAGDCVDIDGVCVDLAEEQGRYCDEEGAQADVILDEEGEVIEVICYPPADDGTPVEELQVGDDGTEWSIAERDGDDRSAVVTLADGTTHSDDAGRRLEDRDRQAEGSGSIGDETGDLAELNGL